jgi:hypothetical protein
MTAAIEAAMLAAHRAGLSVIPLRANKRPAITTWRDRIDAQPDELTVRREASRAEGFAIACGGPTRLQVLDFEGRFMEHIPELRTRLGELGPVFESWLDGYLVETPGGGFHVAVHIEGDDQPGNTKLAMDESGMCLVETRGHGGYVAAAPSNGTTHLSGQPWVQLRGSFDTIAWATTEEWRAICSVISTFDAVAASETPPEAPRSPVPTGGVSLSRMEHTEAWIDGVAVPSIEEVLGHMGWTYSHCDAEHNYWTRPDKDPRDGHSATVNRAGRLFVFSSNAAPVPASVGRQTYDTIDVLGCYQLGHLPSTSERVEILRRFGGPAPRVAADLSVAEPTGWLSDDFWEARPWLAAIRDAAHGNGKCPEALLGAVLSAYSVRVPSSIKVQPVIHGVASPLNLYVALAGPSGSGKSSTMAMAQQLCGAYDDELYRYGINLRSGEGLVTSAIIPQQTKRGEPAPEPRYRLGLQVEFDEGKTLAVQNDRSGSTMVPYLTTAWSGQRGKKVGGTKAAGEESFPADMVRVSLVLGVQFGVAGSLFTGDLESLGFPGRFCYFGMDHPGPKLVAGEQRRVEPLTLPRYWPGDTSRAIGEMSFPHDVQQEVIDWDYLRSTVGCPAIEGHRMLLRMRMAALLALMDDFAQVEPVHWQLAGEIERHSLATRGRVLTAVHEVSAQRARSAGRNDAVRAAAQQEYWIEDRARRLAQWVQAESEQPIPWKAIRARMNADARRNIEAIVSHAVMEQWIVVGHDGNKRCVVSGVRRL